ncbi:putative BPI/LBP family protein [Sesamum angolense]|uniref:BPI/LBP family protein n=1 Tax=Sesamum angolense TaxID=2727404 RepID=A0AAE1W556_9LAMI|nr:putative BPI/LBP family protein [Sesamum angolense]
MASSIFHFLISLLFAFSRDRVLSHEAGHITAEISNKGLDFLKDLLIEKAESSLVPLELPKIEKSVKIPVLGSVQMVLSNIVIERIHVTSSTVKTGDSGIVLDVSGATANLTMNWKYSYSTWLIPIAVSDKGNATVQVEGLEVGLSLSLKMLNGSLKLSLLECGCNVNDISIKLDGGASWLYQGLIDAFEGKIGSAVENAVSKKIRDAIIKLDLQLQSLPKEAPITNIAELNVTFVDDPELSKQDALDFDKVPDQSLLNTAGWRFIIPQLYKMYPNHDMNLNLSVSSPPILNVEKQQIKAKIPLDVVIDVLYVEEVIPVACISTVISASVSPGISGNALTGYVKLNDITMSLKWSKIGDLHMKLVQMLMSTTLRTVVLPYVNLKLSKGFQIPVFHGYGLQDAHILCTDSWIVICSDVAPVKQFNLI